MDAILIKDAQVVAVLRRKCRFICICLMVWVSFGQFSLERSVAQEAILEAALEGIQDSISNLPSTYGMDFVDELKVTSSSEQVFESKESTSFYTNGEQFRFGYKQFDSSAKNGKPTFQRLLVSSGNGEAKAAEITGQGSNFLRVNERKTSLNVGLEESYTYLVNAQERLERPLVQPIQILLNPCFAPLGISAQDLIERTGVMIEGPEDSRLFEFSMEPDSEGRSRIIRLYISSSHSNALVRSDDLYARNIDGKREVVESTVRQVVEWQEIGEGTWVPKHFTVNKQGKGTSLVLDRNISNATIGQLSSDIFDASQLPEFAVKWDKTIDASQSRVSLVAPQVMQEDSFNLGRILLIAINLLFVLTVILLLWKRRLNQPASRS